MDLHYANSIYILFLSADSYTISIYKISTCVQLKGYEGEGVKSSKFLKLTYCIEFDALISCTYTPLCFVSLRQSFANELPSGTRKSVQFLTLNMHFQMKLNGRKEQ